MFYLTIDVLSSVWLFKIWYSIKELTMKMILEIPRIVQALKDLNTSKAK